jgi:hypothetical protein
VARFDKTKNSVSKESIAEQTPTVTASYKMEKMWREVRMGD